MSIIKTNELRKQYGTSANLVKALATKPANILADEPTGLSVLKMAGL